MVMKKITLQMIFDAAWQAFIMEEKPPASDQGCCKYLTQKGDRCAVGLTLPDGHPALYFAAGFNYIVECYTSLFCENILMEPPENLNAFQSRLLDELVTNQNTWKYPVDERRRLYIQVAADYSLTVPEPVTVLKDIAQSATV